MIDPAHLAFNSQRPPVVLEALVDGDKSFPVQDALKLPPHLRSLRLDYTALSFVAPQDVHFRYRLEGHDADWQDAGTRRQAFYNDLPPGQYRFHVIASNNDGVWNDQGASLSFYVMPTFYQRIWFKVLIGLLVLAALWLFYMYRLSLATEQVRIRLTERLAERERIARDLHDTFFQGIQGLLLRFNTATTQLPADEPARPIFVAALEQSDQVMLEGRKLVLDLRDTGESAELEDLISQAGEDLRSLHPAQFQLTMLGERRALQSTTSRELYSLIREALYNAFRHANATLIEVEVHYTAENLTIRVRDNGIGMDEDVLRDGRRAGHWGLPGMYERAAKLGGTLTLWSGAGTGTELEVSIPAASAFREGAKSFLPEWMIRWFRDRRSVTG
jgi:signal transduction histidine kinase